MRPRLLRFSMAGLVVAVAAFAPGARADDVPKGLEKLQGEWKLVALAIDGKESRPAPFDLKVRIKGDAYVLGGKGKGAAKLKAGPGTIDPTLDVTFTEGGSKGETLQCVFEVKGDTLRVCRRNGGKGRPDAVASKSGTVVETYEKVK
jgi:uncharacterized protein (TIGR03067 family)